MENTPELSLKFDSEICGICESPDCTDDSEVTLTDVSADSVDFDDLHRSESSSSVVTFTPSPRSDLNDSSEKLVSDL